MLLGTSLDALLAAPHGVGPIRGMKGYKRSMPNRQHEDMPKIAILVRAQFGRCQAQPECRSL
jgi:hypothetical protein